MRSAAPYAIERPMPNLLPLPEAATLLGVSVDTVRRRIRSGSLAGVQDIAPPHRWRVDVLGTPTQSPGAPMEPPDTADAALQAENAELRRELADAAARIAALEAANAALEADNAALRAELADVRNRQRRELERLDDALDTMKTMARALPAPPTDPPRRRRRWPWQREA